VLPPGRKPPFRRRENGFWHSPLRTHAFPFAWGTLNATNPIHYKYFNVSPMDLNAAVQYWCGGGALEITISIIHEPSLSRYYLRI
jgi:hypothetical protein